MAGTGKTSIAKTVCELASADAEIMLGGSFFCSRSTGLAAQRDIRCVIPTLSQLFALKSAEYRLTLADTIELGVQHKEVAAQVKYLLQTPIYALKDVPVPILFVIDALDECGGQTTDGMLDDAQCHAVVMNMLEALVNLTRSDPKLPVKFLVTSRPETQIRDTSISNEQLSQILRLHTVDVREVNADISRYITETLNAKLSGKPRYRASITETDVENLVHLCDGLFIVAATTIAHTFGKGADAAVAKFKKLLNPSGNGLNKTAAAPLDRMYEMILNDALQEDEPEATELLALQRLLACLLSARTTLSVTALADFTDLEPHNVRASLSWLHAVVHVPEEDDMPGARTVHASFGDYLYSRAPSHICIHQSLGHDILAHGCLDVMAKQLHFNVSQSASSYMSNSPTQTDSITLSLEYACMQWIYHVASVSDTGKIYVKIGVIFRPRLLYWLEVMSILHQVWRAARMLFFAAGTVDTHADSDLAQFFRDAHSFVASSHEAIERSAPHIYLSALPFADRNSLVYQYLAPRCIGLITVDTVGIGQHRGSTVMTLTGHDGAVSSVSYSSDGRLLASGSNDGSVRIWDTRTGEEAMFPMRSGDRKVLSVDFARNGKWVASGTESGAVCIWDVTPGPAGRRILSNHSGSVWSVVYSPDSSRLASASVDGTVRLWNSETCEQLAVQSGYMASVHGIAFSPDGEILESTSDDRRARQWYINTGQVTYEQLTQPVLNSHVRSGFRSHSDSYSYSDYDYDSDSDFRFGSKLKARPFYSVDFSPDGKMLARTDHTGKTVGLFYYNTKENITSLQCYSRINSVQFSPDGRSLVAAFGRAIRLWTLQPDPRNASRVDLGGHGGEVNWVTFSPDGLHIASASDDGTIRIWNAVSGQSTVQPLPVHDSVVRSVAVSHDDAFIVSGSEDKSVRVWNTRTGDGTYLPLCGHTEPVSSASISPDGRLIASALAETLAEVEAQAKAKALAQWQAQGQVKAQAKAQAKANEAALGTELGKTWANARADPSATTQAKAQMVAQAWAQAEAKAEAGLLAYRRWPQVEKQAELLMKAEAKARQAAAAQAEEVQRTCIIRLWDTQSGTAVGKPLRGHSSCVMAVSFSHHGRWLASASGDKTVQIWDVATQQALAVGPLRCQRGANTVAFSPDDGLVAAGDDSGRIYLWRTDTGKKAHELFEAESSSVLSLQWMNAYRRGLDPPDVSDTRVWSVAFSSDGARIVSGGYENAARIWDIKAGQCILILRGYTGNVRSVAWSLDGSIIGTGCEDAKVRLWDAMTGTPLATLRGHTKSVQSVAFTRDGHFLVSGSSDTTIRKWDVRAACQLLSKGSSSPVAALASATLKDGWLVGSSGELISWVPVEYRDYLATIPCTFQFAKSCIIVGVGDDGLRAGLNWTSCWHG